MSNLRSEKNVCSADDVQCKSNEEAIRKKLNSSRIVYYMCVHYSCLFESAKRNEQTRSFKDECLQVTCALRNSNGGSLVIHTYGKPPNAWSLDGFDQLVNEDCSMMVEDETLYTENYERRWFTKQQGDSVVRLDCLVITVEPSCSISTYDFKTKVALDGAKVRPTARQIGTYLNSVGRKREMQAESEPEEEFEEGEATNIYESRNVQIKRLRNEDIEDKMRKLTASGMDEPIKRSKRTDIVRPKSDTTRTTQSTSGTTQPGSGTARPSSGPTRLTSDTTQPGFDPAHAESRTHLVEVPMNLDIVAKWFVDKGLLEYVTAFSKLPQGGSFYCGIIEQKDTSKESKSKNVEGTKTGANIIAGIELTKKQKTELKEKLEGTIAEQTGWYEKDGNGKYKKLHKSSILKYIDIKFLPTEKREAQGKRKYVIEVKVNKIFNGIVFYTDDSYPAELKHPVPLSFKFSNENKKEIVDTTEWFTGIEKAATEKLN